MDGGLATTAVLPPWDGGGSTLGWNREPEPASGTHNQKKTPQPDSTWRRIRAGGHPPLIQGIEALMNPCTPSGGAA